MSLWARATAARSEDPDQARQEFLTRVILVIMEGLLLATTVPILLGWVVGFFTFWEAITILAIDLIVGVFWLLADRGYWKFARYMPVGLFFLFGLFSTYTQGLVTFLMGYVIAIVLAAFLLGNQQQWALVILSIGVHLGLGSRLDPRPPSELFMLFITSSGMFVGIAFLQTLAINQLHRALDNAREFAASLQLENIERKRVEAALKASEEKYRLLVESQGEGVVFVNQEEEFTFVNPATGVIFGVPAEELIGRNLREFTSPAEFARIQEETLKRRQGQKSSYEFNITRADGQLRTLLVTATPLFKNGGEFTGAFGVILDITERKRAEAALARYAQGMEALYDTALEIDSQIELPKLLQAIVQRAALLVGTPMAALYLMTSGGNALEMVISQPPEHARLLLRLGEGLAGRVAQSGEPMIVENYRKWEGIAALPTTAPEANVGRSLGVPLRLGGKVIGVLTVQDYLPGAFDKEEIKLVTLFADQAALAIDKARLYAEVQRLALVDEVTGLLNRRGLWEFGRREFERSRRFNRPLAAIFLDVDHFKQVNDEYGHTIGDQVLRILGERLRSSTRDIDIVARYGGEEFVVLLPEVDIDMATQVAERLRRSAVDSPAVTDQGWVTISLSLGVVQNNSNIHDLAMLIDLADQAMFLAKQSGRNRVAVLGGEKSEG